MKKIFSLVLSLIVLSFGHVYFTTDASANTQDAGTVDAYHNFKIYFSNPIDKNSLNGIVVLDPEGNEIQVEKSLSTNLKTLTVQAPKEGYAEGFNYLLEVPNTIKGTNGNTILSEFTIIFSVSNVVEKNVSGTFDSFADNGTALVIKTNNNTTEKIPFSDDQLSSYYYSTSGSHENYDFETFELLLTAFERAYINFVEQDGELSYYLQVGKMTGRFAGFDEVTVNGQKSDEIVLFFDEENSVIDLPMPDNGTYKLPNENNELKTVTKQQFETYLKTYDSGAEVTYELEGEQVSYTATLAYAEGTLLDLIVNGSATTGMNILVGTQETTIPLPQNATYNLTNTDSEVTKSSREEFISLASETDGDIYIVYKNVDGQTTITMQIGGIIGELKSISSTNLVLTLGNGNTTNIPLSENGDYVITFTNSEAQVVDQDWFVQALSSNNAKATISYSIQDEYVTYTANITNYSGLHQEFQPGADEENTILTAHIGDYVIDVPVTNTTDIYVSFAFDNAVKISKAQLTAILSNSWFTENEFAYTDNNGKLAITINLSSVSGTFNGLKSISGAQYYSLIPTGLTEGFDVPIQKNAEYIIYDANGEIEILSFNEFINFLENDTRSFSINYEWIDNQMTYVIHGLE